MEPPFRNVSALESGENNSVDAQAEAKFEQGLILHEQGQLEQAQEYYHQALKLQPQHFKALHRLGMIAYQVRDFSRAVELIGKAISVNPEFDVAYNNHGLALQKLERWNESLESFDQAINLGTNRAEIFINRGFTLYALNRLDEALLCYEYAIKNDEKYAFLYASCLHIKMKICDWSNLEDHIKTVIEDIENNKKLFPPFLLLALTDSLELQHKATEIWPDIRRPTNYIFPAIIKQAKRNKIRIGYYSADYYNHATSYLMAELFEQHDRSRFEIIGFSFGPNPEDGMNKRVSAAFDQFINVHNKSDKEVILLSRSMAIDIAVDLKGFTEGNRLGIFSCRAAPIQVSYLGYPGTMGAEYIDYLIADRILIPDTSQQFYTEKIAYLPNSYQVNDRKREIANKVFSREELGLPMTGFVFCCFNSSYKIMPAIFDVWMRILKQVEGSVLWLLEDNATAVNNLRNEAESRGVSSQRLVFANRMAPPEHLARHRLADLFIDTLPYNAHTTASDALWAGLPILTCLGSTFPSRVAASLLNAVGLPELITTTQKEYELLAVDLATNPDKLRQIRKKLEKNRLTMPLFDTALFVRHIEDVYEKMYERYQADLPPKHIYATP